MESDNQKGLPRNFRVAGTLILIFALPLIVRILWEETFLTCERGPQAVGFAMGHVMPALLILGSLGVLVALIWLACAAYLALWKRIRLTVTDRVFVATVLILVCLMFVPYGFWEYSMRKICGPEQNAAELLVSGGGFLNRAILRIVLLKHPNVNDPLPEGETLIGIASSRADLAMVRLLIARGANVNSRDGDSTPLVRATRAGNFEILKALIEAGADPGEPGRDGFTAAGVASAMGHEAIAQYLDSKSAASAK
jgi:hypothetical protein